MPTDILDALEAAHRKATEGEWRARNLDIEPYISVVDRDGLGRRRTRFVACFNGADLPNRANAEFCSLAHNTWPALLAVAQKARDISLSGMEPDDERLDYYTVQVDKREWKALRAALAALESPEGGRDGE